MIISPQLHSIIHGSARDLRANPKSRCSGMVIALSTTISNPEPNIAGSLPISPFDRLSTDDALCKWLHDLTSYGIAQIHGDAPPQVRLLTDALTNILHQHSDSVVPTIAYQLAQNISQAGDPIARTVGEDPTAFAPRCHDQVDVVNPIGMRSNFVKKSKKV